MISGVSSAAPAWPARREDAGYQARPAEEDLSPGSPPDGSEDADSAKQPGSGAGLSGQLSDEEQQIVNELQARDREVRAHEAAHKSVGGSLAGGMSFSYQTGPDGRRYAVGGEVSIDMGSGGDPQATIAKMRQVISAALAPANPSSQDRSVAASARAAMADAQQQLSAQQREASRTDDKKSAEDTSKSKETEGAKPFGPAAKGYGRHAEPSGGLLSLIA